MLSILQEQLSTFHMFLTIINIHSGDYLSLEAAQNNLNERKQWNLCRGADGSVEQPAVTLINLS